MSDEKIVVNTTLEKYTHDRFKLLYVNEENNGCVYIHELTDINADDFQDVYEIAVDKANQGCFVKMLPELNSKDTLRDTLYLGAKENKCPDLSVNGEFVEIKTPTLPLKRNKLSNCIKNSKEQANYVIIRLLAKYNESGLQNVAVGRFEIHQNLERVEFKCCSTGNYFSYTQ